MKRFRKPAALCAAFLLSLCLCSGVVHAEEATAAPGKENSGEAVLPPGTGKVAEVYADDNGRKFYTIQTPAGNTFYLVIDFTKETENVYFLDAVTEKDLLALAEKAGNAISAEETTGAEQGGAPSNQPSGKAATEPETKDTGGMFNMILIGAVVLIGGGLALYFKVFRKKKNNDMREEYEEETYSPEEPEEENDLPPWEDDDNV